LRCRPQRSYQNFPHPSFVLEYGHL
jgi:hypothetical protein